MECQHNGLYELVVYVDAALVKHAEAQAARFGTFDAAEYIQDVLFFALWRDFAITEEQKREPPLVLPHFDDDDPDARW